MKKVYLLIGIVIIIGVLIALSYQNVFYSESVEDVINSLTKGVEKSIKVYSTSFKDGDYIPSKYTCDGADISPHLGWTGIPDGTKSIMVIVYDPDAPKGYFIHWVIYNIPSTVEELREGVSGRGRRSTVGVEAMNDFRKIGYGGPCPPPGKPHRYIFLVLALDITLPADKTYSALDIMKRAEGHVLAYGSIIGLYRRG